MIWWKFCYKIPGANFWSRVQKDYLHIFFDDFCIELWWFWVVTWLILHSNMPMLRVISQISPWLTAPVGGMLCRCFPIIGHQDAEGRTVTVGICLWTPACVPPVTTLVTVFTSQTIVVTQFLQRGEPSFQSRTKTGLGSESSQIQFSILKRWGWFVTFNLCWSTVPWCPIWQHPTGLH